MRFCISRNKQLCFIKYFFIKNIKLLIFIIIVILICLMIGWNYWRLRQLNLLKKSSQIFDLVSSQLQSDSEQALLTSKRFADVSNNIYGVLINIELAKIAVEKHDIISAEKRLLKALKISQLDDLKDLVNLRLARIQLALNKTEESLNTLSKIKSKSWNMIIENIRGDILFKKNDIIGARTAYIKGTQLDGTEIMKNILKLKINSLPN